MASYWIYGITLNEKIDNLNESELTRVRGVVERIMLSDGAVCREVTAESMQEYSSWKVILLYERDRLLSELEGIELLRFEVRRGIKPIKHVKVVDALIDPRDFSKYEKKD